MQLQILEKQEQTKSKPSQQQKRKEEIQSRN